MSPRPRSLRSITQAERAKTIVQLRRQGRPYRAIADELGLAVATVHGYMQRAMAQLPAPDAELHRREQLDRLDSAVAGLWPGVTAGDPKSVMALTQVEARRAALLGLDQPTRVAIGPDDRRELDELRRLRDADDEELASDLFDGFGELLHVALTTDADRALNTIAAAGCIVGLNEEGARRYRRDREAR